MGKRMRKLIVILLAVSAIGVIVFPIASAQQTNVAFWTTDPQVIDAIAADFAIPLGPSRATNVDLSGGQGSCPSGGPKPVQDFVFIDKGGGGATVIKGIVMSVEVRPGSKARQFTASASCSTTDPNNPGTMITWYKFVATSVD